MKTRKYKGKGGFLGLRALKTRRENLSNCHRLANNYHNRDDFLYRKYKCATSNKHEVLCNAFRKNQGEMHRKCETHKMIDDFDFSRDGLRLKKRIQPFFREDKLQANPEDIDLTQWDKMHYHFKPVHSSVGTEYVLRTEDEIMQYNPISR